MSTPSNPFAFDSRFFGRLGGRGDGSGSYGNVVRGMVLLQQAGAEQVGLLTDGIDDTESER